MNEKERLLKLAEKYKYAAQLYEAGFAEREGFLTSFSPVAAKYLTAAEEYERQAALLPDTPQDPAIASSNEYGGELPTDPANPSNTPRATTERSALSTEKIPGI